jgi:hypothetical protein
MRHMRRWFATLIGALTVVALGLSPAVPVASAVDAPIGNLGDTLRVEYQGIVADVIVRDVLPTDTPPGYAPTGSPRWRNEGGPWRADVTVHAIKVPNPHAMAVVFDFDGVTPFADAYEPKRTDAPDALDTALLNVPTGATANGAVYWQVYRAGVTNVILLDPHTGVHLAQWNVFPPGTPLP